jgi:phage-related protein (TIGR01555 family)
MIQRNLRQGWGAKKFESIKDDVFRYGNALEMAIQALCRLSEDILKLDGLTEILAMEGGDEAIQRRLHLLDMARHLMNTIAIDGKDEYDRKGLSLAGIKDIIEKFETALCADTGIPATRLFGRSPDGMNSTGESDETNYVSMIERKQDIEVKPRLVKFIDMLSYCRDYKLNLPPVWSIEFESLLETSKKDKAEIELKRSQAQKARADALVELIDAQVVDGIEARDTLAEDKAYKLDRSLDNALQRNGNEP